MRTYGSSINVNSILHDRRHCFQAFSMKLDDADPLTSFKIFVKPPLHVHIYCLLSFTCSSYLSQHIWRDSITCCDSLPLNYRRNQIKSNEITVYLGYGRIWSTAKSTLFTLLQNKECQSFFSSYLNSRIFHKFSSKKKKEKNLPERIPSIYKLLHESSNYVFSAPHGYCSILADSMSNRIQFAFNAPHVGLH